MEKILTNEPNPVLYILMRTDMHSMNPGKAMAQACHAANCFVGFVQSLEKAKAPKHLINLLKYWQNSTKQHFGTTIVLDGGKLSDIQTTISKCMSNPGNVAAGMIWDPSYPINDGSTMHYLNIPTCAYVFLDNKDLENCAPEIEALKKLPLHR